MREARLTPRSAYLNVGRCSERSNRALEPFTRARRVVSPALSLRHAAAMRREPADYAGCLPNTKAERRIRQACSRSARSNAPGARPILVRPQAATALAAQLASIDGG